MRELITSGVTRNRRRKRAQHDRTFMRPLDLAAVLATLRAAADVQMVSLLTRSTMRHVDRVRSRTSRPGVPSVLKPSDWSALAEPRIVAGVRLVRLLQWLDSTHLARVR